MKYQEHPHRCVDCDTRTVHYQGWGWMRCSKCEVTWKAHG